MRDNAKKRLAISRLVGPGGQSRTKPSLVLRDCAFYVPAAAVEPPGKPAIHLPTVTACRHRLTRTARIKRDDRQSYGEFFPAYAVVLLGVIGRIGVQPINRHILAGLANSRQEAWGIVGRPPRDSSAHDQMAAVMADDRQLGIAAVPFHPALADQKVAAYVMALKTRGVHRRLRSLVNQTAIAGVAEDSRKQSVKSPFFRSRFSA